MTHDLATLLARVQQLEQRSQRHRRFAGAALIGLLGVPLLAAFLQDPATPKPAASTDVADVVRAKGFELVDDKGVVRGRLGFHKDGGSELRLFDAAGKVRARLGIHKDSDPLLTLVDGEDHNRVSLIYDSNPHIVLHQKGGKPIVHLTAGETGAASLLFTHVDGNHNAGIGIHTSGDGFLIQRKNQ